MRNMLYQPPFKRKAGAAVICSLIYLGQAQLLFAEEEVSAFKLYDVEGYVGLGYLQDKTEKGETEEEYTYSRLTTNREEIYLLTHSYVYHPNFLKVDFGGGLLFTQNELESSAGGSEYDEELYSLTAYLRFLEKKPYPVTIYYDRTNPSVSHSLTERYIQEHEKYGINASLLEPLLPFSIELNAYRQTSKGEGESQVTDEQNDRVFLRAYSSIGKDGHGQLTYQSDRRESRSGSKTPGYESRDYVQSESESFSLDNRFLFGEQRQIDFNNVISYYTQEGNPERKEFRLSPNLNWQHSKQTYSYYRMDYFNSEVNQLESENTNATVGVGSELTKNTSVGVQADAARSKMEGLETSTNNYGANLNYNYPLSFGKFVFSVNLRHSETDRDAATETVRQDDEPVRLDGLSRVALRADYIDVDSIEVTSAGNVQPYTRGEDYELDTIGATTYIFRIPGSSIGDPETVEVDYEFETSGSVAYNTMSQNYHTGLEFMDYYTVYFDYADTEHTLESGEPTNPLNNSVYRRYGFKVDHPFSFDTIRVGGEIMHEERDENVSSYTGDSQEIFINTQFTPNLKLYLSEYRLQRDNFDTLRNVDSEQDIDLRRQTARLTTHPWPRSSLSLEWLNEEDHGGTYVRRYKRIGIVGEWRLRKLVFTMDGRQVEESYGASERRHIVFSALLRRNF